MDTNAIGGVLVYLVVGFVLYYFGDVEVQNVKFPPLARFLFGPILVAVVGYAMFFVGHLMMILGNILSQPIDMFIN